MQNKEIEDFNLAYNIGYWSALVCASSFIIFTICYISILSVNPVFIWTNVTDFAAYTHKNTQLFKYIAQFMMIIFGVSYTILLGSIFEYTQERKKILARLSIYFGIIFAMLISIHYFIQLSTVRINIFKGNLQGLEQFIQSNPSSAISAINMLGWSLFLGLSSLFIAPVFSNSRLERIIHYAFIANGVICITGVTGYIYDITVLVFLSMNFGMGAALLVATISLSILFKRRLRISP
jgi:hypothetical protein